MIAAFVIAAVAVSLGIAVWTGRTHRHSGAADFIVGGRSFPAWLVYFLAVGEIYSIGTVLGVPSGIYAKGASYGVWYIGYIVLAYALGYYVAPLLWRAAHRYGSLTVPDLLRSHYRSRVLEVIAAITMLVALIPFGEYQFLGLQVVLDSMGIHLTATAAVVIAGVLAFLYISVSGIRSPATLSILKDALLVVAVVGVGLGAAFVAHSRIPGGIGAVPVEARTVHGSAMTFAITTMVYQAVVFYLGLGSNFVMTARSERAMKSSTVWMPLYMLIFPFLVYGAYYAVRAYPHAANPNTVFMTTAQGVLPRWVVGLVAAGACLSGLVVLAAFALVIGALVSRNLIPNVPADKQRRLTTLCIAGFLVLAALMTLYASSLMLTALNLTYALIAQVVPAVVAVIWTRRTPAWALVAGMVVGALLTVWLFQFGPGPSAGGVNSGLLALAANCVVIVVWRLVAPGPERAPVALSDPNHRDEAVAAH